MSANEIEEIFSSLIIELKNEINPENEGSRFWQANLDQLQALQKNYTEYKEFINQDFKIYWYISTLSGLSIYFDEHDWDLLENFDKIKNTVSKIVQMSLTELKKLQIKIITQKCGSHEDRACVVAQPSSKHRIFKEEPYPDKNITCPLKINTDGCFVDKPNDIMLPRGSRMMRVVGPGNKIDAPWWILSHLPNSVKKWRQDFAVLCHFNDDNEYVEFTLTEDIPAWIGKAANQKVWWENKLGNKVIPNQKCILLGGGTQIYLNPNDVPKNLIRKFTNW